MEQHSRAHVAGASDHIASRLHDVAESVERQFDDVVRGLGISTKMYFALEIIDANPGIDGLQLAEALQLAPSTTCRILGDLARRNLLVSASPPDGSSRRVLSILPAGADLLCSSRVQLGSLVTRFRSRFSSTEFGLLVGLLNRLGGIA